MKAEEVLRRYATGDRNFQNANLRGQNFTGQDFSGADFSGGDICSTNFTNANLVEVNFSGAKAGLQRQWMIGQLLFVTALYVLLNFASVFLHSLFIAAFFSPGVIQQYTIVPGVMLILFVVVAFFTIAQQGITFKALSTIAVALAAAIVFAIIAGVVVTIVNVGRGAGAGTGAVAGVAVGTGAGLGAVVTAGIAAIVGADRIIKTSVGTVVVAISVIMIVIFAVVFAVVSTGAGINVFTNVFTVAATVAVITTVTVTLTSLYVASRSLKNDERFALVRTIGIAFGAIGGTSFRGANLTGANFSTATLKSTNFNPSQQRRTILTHTCWNEVKQLDRARVGDSILADAKVQKLLVTRNGYQERYIGANFEGANLKGVNLTEANLTRANLSNANLERAELQQANLKEILATGASFTNAYLTGVCLEAWNIDSTTILDNVDCQYVFLLEQPNPKGSRERRPHDPDAVFKPGDFEKLYKKMINVVQILLRNGINREAFAEAFQNLMEEHPGIDYTSIQGIEKKGDDVLVTLEVPETADKAKIAQAFLQPYEHRVKQLEAKTEQLQLHAADLKDIAIALAQKPIVNQAVGQGTAMQNDSSQNIHVGRDLNLTGSTLNLGEISGNVTNQINQLPDDPATADQPSLKDLLTQLQQAITSDTDLEETDKADLLEQVQALATAKQTAEPTQKEGIVRKAKKMFEATLKSLPETAKIVEACSKLLPMILKALGVPV